ncbi:MAG TPA: methyltransferase domain-containing protein [Burkholderiaceae bacterium]|nr:methyltransferase domain-containing protein [Burkholderiaceae bacterium]
MLAWEQQELDLVVADLFGFHALQLGLPQLDALRANRMPHRWLAGNGKDSKHPLIAPPPGPPDIEMPSVPQRIVMQCQFDALPFPSQSLDLVVLPHALELAGDPHETLREVERVLMPEGRVVILGFNPASLWGLRQRLGRVRQAFGGRAPLFLPKTEEMIGYWRMRDWLRLLSFEIEGGRFGCYRPAMRSQRWLDRFGWIESTGDRWWPVFGAVYFLLAVKRVRGMRLVGLKRKDALKAKAAPAVVANRRRHRIEETLDS